MKKINAESFASWRTDTVTNEVMDILKNHRKTLMEGIVNDVNPDNDEERKRNTMLCIALQTFLQMDFDTLKEWGFENESK